MFETIAFPKLKLEIATLFLLEVTIISVQERQKVFRQRQRSINKTFSIDSILLRMLGIKFC